MCGIVGAISERNVLSILLAGLKRLEYRGYDSAGFALIQKSQSKIKQFRAVGKVKVLAHKVHQPYWKGTIGIAHTRWATHGAPSLRNAHPHLSNSRKIAIVHNGIIENFMALKNMLIDKGVIFSSETDSEVIVHLLEEYWDNADTLFYNVQKAVKYLSGTYGLAIIHHSYPNKIIVVRSGSPIVIGYGIGENFISSDSLSLLPVTNRFSYLDDDDIAIVGLKEVRCYNSKGDLKSIEISEVNQNQDLVSKKQFKHYMKKEIFEQPEVITNTLLKSVSNQNEIIIESFGINAKSILEKVNNIKIVACGTSFYSGLVAKFWLEEYAKVSVEVEIASELRYRKATIRDNTLFVTVSQSGETADTLASLRQAKTLNYLSTLAICNVVNSSLVRESHLVFITKAGIEVGVASTKAFTSQLVVFLLLTLALAKSQKQLDIYRENSLVLKLKKIPEQIKKVLLLDAEIARLSKDFIKKNHALFLGRGIHYPVALEGALKLKEVSYIHAEAYPAGELKHGPLALVDREMPVIAVVPNDALLEKIESNLQEVQARGGALYVFVDYAVKDLHIHRKCTLVIDSMPEIIAPIIFTVPLQLFAYHVAVNKGTDVDQPRNLAKSVTVE